MKKKHYGKYRNLGLSIAYFRKNKGVTQQQLANFININYETISRIENANTGISSDLLFELSDALEVSLGTLFSHADI